MIRFIRLFLSFEISSRRSPVLRGQGHMPRRGPASAGPSFPGAFFRRQRSIFLWSPENRTGGDRQAPELARPRVLGIVEDPAGEGIVRGPSPPCRRRPGTKRAAASTTTAAASSPPDRT
ncbi:MAG: hypothetical protein MZV64_34125 [Ignavibacteriales bacterium]|nr:hypothetical protein [Ignavibacteriales bacterium]